MPGYISYDGKWKKISGGNQSSAQELHSKRWESLSEEAKQEEIKRRENMLMIAQRQANN